MNVFRFMLLLCSASLWGSQEALQTEWMEGAAPTVLAKQSSLRLGFINLRKIIAHAPQNDSIRNRLDQEFKEEQKALLESQAELSSLEKQLLSPDENTAVEHLQRQIIHKRRDLAQRDISFRDNYSIRRNEEMIQLQDLIMQEIIQLAEEEHYDIILNDTGVLYVHESADLTLKVIQRLEKKGE